MRVMKFIILYESDNAAERGACPSKNEFTNVVMILKSLSHRAHYIKWIRKERNNGSSKLNQTTITNYWGGILRLEKFILMEIH